MKPKTPSRPLAIRSPLLLVCGLALLALVIAIAVRSGAATAASDVDLAGETLVSGDFSPISDQALRGSLMVTGPGAPAWGALVYDDFVQMETEARAKLKNGLQVREALSPYQGQVPFQQYVVKFDAEKGWDQSVPQGTTPNPYGTTLSLKDLVDRADTDLRRARDLYAFLVVYGPEARFRQDATYTGGGAAALCGITDKENPDPLGSGGLAGKPVIDWCNFRARLRQSIREAANLRLLFGQQFMVDAMGLHFSGTELLGGEAAVTEELGQLQDAKKQYAKAAEGLKEGLDRVVGSGCYISDFYTQTEWALLSRATENQETAQHHIAVRLSYMGIDSTTSAGLARERANAAYRQAAVDGYIEMVAMAGKAQERTPCQAADAHPDGQLAAQMAAKLLETRRAARELGEGRNVFGFDVTFTPARLYSSAPPVAANAAVEPDLAAPPTCTSSSGLLEEAQCLADEAEVLEEKEKANTRVWEQTQAELLREVERIRTEVDGAAGDNSGCYRSDVGTDEAWYACVNDQLTKLRNCLDVIDDESTTNNKFDACMAVVKDNAGAVKQAILDLRAVYVEYWGIKEEAHNIEKQVKLLNDCNVNVRTWLAAAGAVETAARTAEAMAGYVDCMSVDPGKQVGGCAILESINTVAQAAAGAVSTAADVMIADAENHKEVQTLLIQQSELVIHAYGAYQQFLSKQTEVERLFGEAEYNLSEAQRARAYFQHSPANDPSYRMVRDSSRLQLAKAMTKATRAAYLAARRAEYEYATRLSASKFRISDIYRARNADDIKQYLSSLKLVTNNLPGGPTYSTRDSTFTVSVAQHLLQLTDEALAKEGLTGDAAKAARKQRFQAWVKKSTVTDPACKANPALRFSFGTSLLDGGLWSQVIRTGYDHYWLLKLSGDDTKGKGARVILRSDQAGLDRRTVVLTQGGLAHLRSLAGCVFDYRLLAPAKLLGLDWPANQEAEKMTAVWEADVKKPGDTAASRFTTPVFKGRSVSATDWQVLVCSAAPAVGLPVMDLNQLTDIELVFDATYASREPGQPQASDCIRFDY